MRVQGIITPHSCSLALAIECKTQRQHPHTHRHISHSQSHFRFPFRLRSSPSNPLPYAASNWFLYCERRQQQQKQRRRRRRIIFLFASRVLLSPGSLRSLFSSFCCYLPPFVPCILGTVAVYAPLRFASYSLSLSLSLWFDCRASRSPLSVV